MHAGGGADNGGEKRNVRIVIVLLPIIIDLALCSKTQGASRPCGSREQPILQEVATAPEAVTRDAEVEDQALAVGLVSQVVSDFHVAAPLARAAAGRDSMLGADRVSSVRKRRPTTETNQSCALDAPE